MISILAFLLLFSAVLGTFVLNMGPQEPARVAPNANLEFEANDSGTVTISHDGGEALTQSEIEIRSPGSVGEWPSQTLTAGEKITVSGLESGDEIEIIRHSPDGDSSALVATYTVP